MIRIHPHAASSLLVLAALALAACDGDGGGDDAGPGIDSGALADGGAQADAGGADAAAGADAGGGDAGDAADAAMGSACYMEGSALLAAGDTVEVDQPECSPQDIADVFECMFGGGGGSACRDDFGLGSPPDVSAPKFGCSRCLVAFDTAGPAPVVNQGSRFGYPNIYACQAAAEGRPSCGIPVSRRVFCAQTACESCNDGSDPAPYDACLTEAREGLCQDIDVPVECEDLLDTETFAAECQGSDFMETFMLMGEYFCGGPMRGG